MSQRKITPATLQPLAVPDTHLTSKVLMVRPVQFGFNEETAVNNAFQKKSGGAVQEQALREFNSFVELLETNGVDVVVIDDTPDPHTPDSIFPNNWFSTHLSGELVLYPMCAPNRRRERKEAPQKAIRELGERSCMKRTVDLSGWEANDKFLEGTGSMVLDRANRISFVCRSPRSDEAVLAQWCEELDYSYYYFDALDRNDGLIYHTNVMMCMGDTFVVVCLCSIRDEKERQGFIEIVEKCNKEIIDITIKQMEHFAGNMLQVKSRGGESLLLMSRTAESSLTESQIKALKRHCRILAPEIGTIETNGGGSARCMLAEMFF